MNDSSASYIHMVMKTRLNGLLLLHAFLSRGCLYASADLRKSVLAVQHLIEKCLIFKMSKEECMDALSKHANIKPVITSTVWNELEKENKDFFKAYSESQSEEDRMSEAETSAMIQKMVSPDHDHDHDQENPKEPPEEQQTPHK